jgi:hypothetical protein
MSMVCEYGVGAWYGAHPTYTHTPHSPALEGTSNIHSHTYTNSPALKRALHHPMLTMLTILCLPYHAHHTMLTIPCLPCLPYHAYHAYHTMLTCSQVCAPPSPASTTACSCVSRAADQQLTNAAVEYEYSSREYSSRVRVQYSSIEYSSTAVQQ